MRRSELIVALVLAVAGALMLAVLIPNYVAGDPSSDGLSPAFMPYVAAVLATLSALAMLVGGLRRGTAASASETQPALTRDNLRFLAAAAVVLGVSYALMSLFGYLAGGIALTAGILKLARVRVVPLVVTSLAAPVVLWLFFVALLATPLP